MVEKPQNPVKLQMLTDFFKYHQICETVILLLVSSIHFS